MEYIHKLTIACFITAFTWNVVDSACFIAGTQFVMTNTNTTSMDPLDFRDCYGATLVNISHNQINVLKNTTFEYNWNIHILDISYNMLTEVPDNVFKGLRQIKYLNLSHNILETLPLTFFVNKPYLITVDLSHNRISNIPLPVFNYTMTSILEINLQYNRLTAFEPWAYGMQPIRLLDVRFNNISTFTNTYNWTYDHRLVYDAASTDIRNNSLVTWHDWYLLQYKTGSGTIEAAMVELLTDIRDNPLHCDCNFFNVVQTITNSFYRYSHNPYTTVTCYSPPELSGKRIFFDVRLDQFVCNLTIACPSGCLCQERPNEKVLSVDCQGQGLTKVPTSVPDSRYNNIIINLANNSIANFNNVSYLDQVINLTMANNDLQTLPDFVMEAVAKDDRAFVDFRNNKITSIPENTQNIKYQNAKFSGNNLECTCDMLWMIDWINLAPKYEDKNLNCTFEGKVYKIIDLTEDILNCHDIGNIIMIVVLSVALVIVIALLVTAKRCPYETKVILYKIFRIHPSDKYKIDETEDMTYDMYVSFDEKDDYVRQWVMRKLFKTLEEKKPFYKLCTPVRNGAAGAESEVRLDLIDKSRRLLIILSQNYEQRRWNDYDLCHAEQLEQNEGRVMFILYDKVAIENSTKEPMASKLKERKVFTVHDRLLWSKLRYEMPRAACVHQRQKKHQTETGKKQADEDVGIDMY